MRESLLTAAGRVLVDAAFLAILGAVLGAAAGVAFLSPLLIPELLDMKLAKVMVNWIYAVIIGAPLGAAIGPTLGWLVLRRVPSRPALWSALLGTLAGAYLALLGGWLFADVDDGRGIVYCVVGAVCGITATVLALRWRYRNYRGEGVLDVI